MFQHGQEYLQFHCKLNKLVKLLNNITVGHSTTTYSQNQVCDTVSKQWCIVVSRLLDLSVSRSHTTMLCLKFDPSSLCNFHNQGHKFAWLAARKLTDLCCSASGDELSTPTNDEQSEIRTMPLPVWRDASKALFHVDNSLSHSSSIRHCYYDVTTFRRIKSKKEMFVTGLNYYGSKV